MEPKYKKLRDQIVDSAANVLYTYDAHWNIVNRLKCRYTGIKITQIVLTALSTGGVFASILTNVPWLGWVGGLTSALSLGLNLYSLHFNIPSDIKNHTDAANELWDVRERYKALIVDFDDLSKEEIRFKRDEISKQVGIINKKYPGTDEKSFMKAQNNLQNYIFKDGEAARYLHVKEE